MSKKHKKKKWKEWLRGEGSEPKPKLFVRATTLGSEVCPVCQGAGFEVVGNRADQEGKLCRLCHGRGKISLAVCRGCGRPAAWRRYGVTYCGGKKCRAMLMAKALEVRNGYVQNFGPTVGRSHSDYMNMFDQFGGDDGAWARNNGGHCC